MQRTQVTALLGVLVLLGVVVGAKVVKTRDAPQDTPPAPAGGEVVIVDSPVDDAAPRDMETRGTGDTNGDSTGHGLPRLLELGSVGCKACKQMEPILAELAEELDGEVTVEFIDIAKDPSAVNEYEIKLIPTQILFDASGAELHRHEGVYAKDELLAKMREVGMVK